MKRKRSPREGQRRTPRHPDTQIQSFTEWLDDHGWTYQATHTWVWPKSGKTMHMPDDITLGTTWVIAATCTAMKIMDESKPKRRKPRLMAWSDG